MLKSLLKWTLAAAGISALVCLGALVAGAMLPARIEVTRSIRINRPPENVWWVLTDYGNMPLWHPQYKNAAQVSAFGDKPMRWRATYSDGYAALIEVSEENPPTHLVERIITANLPFSGAWKIDMVRNEQITTELTAHSMVDLHRPLDRLFVRLFLKPDQELDKILNALKRRVEAATIKPSAATS